jgi:hypothetical protein
MYQGVTFEVIYGLSNIMILVTFILVIMTYVRVNRLLSAAVGNGALALNGKVGA